MLLARYATDGNTYYNDNSLDGSFYDAVLLSCAPMWFSGIFKMIQNIHECKIYITVYNNFLCRILH